jgi:cytosine/creatinine deaminase
MGSLRPMPDQLLRGATLTDGSGVDVRIRDGRVDAVGALRPAPSDVVVELDGRLLLAAAAEPHAHLDKAFLADRLTNERGDLPGAIDTIVAARPSIDLADTVERAERAARLMAANGFGFVRTHVDTTLDNGLLSVEALAEVRRRVADQLDMEIVALSGWPVAGDAGAEQRSLLRDAIARGADLVGGCPHLENGAVRAATETLLTIADETGVGVDLHTDETLDPSANGLAELADVVTSTGFARPVTASHCVSLGMQSVERQRELAEVVAAAGIAVVALPATNLYLQGRDHQQAMPRGLTAVRALRDAGVVVAAGGDNLQDPFNPLGRGCPFETAALMLLTAHLSPAESWAAVTDDARRAVHRPPLAVAPGAPADLLAVRAGSLRAAIATGPPERMVWHRGRRVPADVTPAA